MINTQINKLGMYLVVITVLEKFNAIIATIPALATVVAAFKALVANITSLSENVDLGTMGKTKVKQTTASVMAETVASLVGALHAYACDQNDADLMEQTDISETDIIHTRDAKRASYANSLVDLVEQKKGAVVDWGVSGEDIAAARQSITDYSDSLSKRDSAKTEQESGRESIDAMVAKADRILYRQIDKLVKRLKVKNPDFFAEYQAARVIRDVAATRKGNGKPPVPPVSAATAGTK